MPSFSACASVSQTRRDCLSGGNPTASPPAVLDTCKSRTNGSECWFVRLVALCFALTLIGAAQNMAPASASSPPKNYKVNCSTMGVAPGCESYNEILQSKDKDVREYLAAGYALACFREKEDVFTIVSFQQPTDDQFLKDPKTSGLSAFGVMFFTRFSKGLTDDSKWLNGKWHRFSPNSDPSFVFHDEGKALDGSIDPAEIKVSYSLTHSNTRTEYSFQVRRSTLRFTETWQFKDDLKKTSGKRTASGGHCALFH